nr:DNA helicase [Tanacetum cinerariifolium]
QQGQKKRPHHFGGEESGFKKEIVEGWIDFLNNNNALIHFFRTARNKMSEVDIPEYQLFQQYVIVTAYCAIEQSRTDFLRAKQNEIRNEFLSTLYYAITRGDLDGRDAGLRIILPVSFTGGPRINPYGQGRCHRPRTLTLGQIFALMKSHLATSQQTAKRSKVCKDEGVDAYVSAELPDPIVDPKGLRDQEVQILAVHLENRQHVSSKNPVSLWKSHWKTTSDDIPRRLSELLRIPKIHLRGPALEAGVLYELEVASTGYGKSVEDYGVPLPPPRLLDILKNKTFMEKKNYDRE